MKYSVVACKDLTDVVHETAVLHEYNAKVKIANCSIIGIFVFLFYFETRIRVLYIVISVIPFIVD